MDSINSNEYKINHVKIHAGNMSNYVHVIANNQYVVTIKIKVFFFLKKH